MYVYSQDTCWKWPSIRVHQQRSSMWLLLWLMGDSFPSHKVSRSHSTEFFGSFATHYSMNHSYFLDTGIFAVPTTVNNASIELTIFNTNFERRLRLRSQRLFSKSRVALILVRPATVIQCHSVLCSLRTDVRNFGHLFLPFSVVP